MDHAVSSGIDPVFFYEIFIYSLIFPRVYRTLIGLSHLLLIHIGVFKIFLYGQFSLYSRLYIFKKGEVGIHKKVFRFTFIPCSLMDLIGINYLYVDSLKL